MSLVVMAVLAPWLHTIDPNAADPANRNLSPGLTAEFNSLTGETFVHTFLMGADALGRDIWSRVLYGARISLTVGLSVAALSCAVGAALGTLAGYFRRLDGLIMRTLDAVMAIPSVLFAIALVAIWRPSLFTVIFAISIVDAPRVARVVRSVVLTVREEPFVEAAVALNTPAWRILCNHILPNALAPLLVQATYLCASAIMVEAIMSFLGIGLPIDVPSWGNMMAEGRASFTQHPHNVLLPGAVLSLAVLSINLLGDAFRDHFDPRFSRGRRPR